MTFLNSFKLFFSTKSRFYFNISFLKILQKIIFYILSHKKNYKKILSKEFKKFFPNSNVTFFNHGRGGFYVLLKYFSHRSKKKVLINSLTLFEMINMIIYSGYEPVFIDNKKDNFESNTIDLINKYSDDISFVVVTHLNGLNGEIFEIKKRIEEINKNLNKNDKIYLIEDVAVSFGAKFNNNYCGSLGDFSILSFNIMKNITSLTGGALIDNTNSIDFNILNKNNIKISIIDILKKIFFVFLIQFLNSKIIFPFFFIFIRIAQKNNYHFFLKKYRSDFQTYVSSKIPLDFLKEFSNFQSFLLIDQLNNIEVKNKKRIYNAKYYYENLKKNEQLIFPQTDFNENNIFIDFPVICKTKEYKNYILSKSFDCYVDIKNYYYTDCAGENIYSKFNLNKCINSKIISENIIMLPVNINGSKNDLNKVIKLFE